jgi:hypothetical protein
MVSCEFDGVISEMLMLESVEDSRSVFGEFLRKAKENVLMKSWLLREKTFVLKSLYGMKSRDMYVLNKFLEWCVVYGECNEQYMINNTLRGEAVLKEEYKAMTKYGKWLDIKWTGVGLKNHPEVLWRGLMSGKLESSVESQWIEHAKALVKKDVRYGVTFDVLREEEMSVLPNYETFRNMRDYKAKMIDIMTLKLTLRGISNKAPKCGYKGSRYWSVYGNEDMKYCPYTTMIGEFVVGKEFSIAEDMTIFEVNWMDWMARMPDKGRGYFLDFPTRTFVGKVKKKRGRKYEGGGAAKEARA